MSNPYEASHQILRRALEARGHRITDQRAAVYRFLVRSSAHPTADEVYRGVRDAVPGISLATVYKSLETLVSCDLARKLGHAGGCARYDGRTDPHHHARCLACGSVSDVPGQLRDSEISQVRSKMVDFLATGYHLEFTGYCVECAEEMDREVAGAIG